MIIKRNLFDKEENYYTVVTVGTFDGVHVGHRKIIEKLVANAKANDLKSTILTFFPHPRMVLQQSSDLKLLNTLEEKISILKETGLDQLIIHPFTKEFSRLTAEQYVKEVLVDSINAKKVIIGYDHRFGRNRTATIKDLIKFGEKYDFEVEQISVEEVDEVSVSSTKIRKALNEGDIETANTFLGYPYMLSGTITKGKGLGKQIDFPTANISIKEKYKLVPKKGVYVVKSNYNDVVVYGMMNIGYNPTVNGQKKTIEVHFLNFDEDLYDKEIRVELLERLRDEKRFDSIEDLKKQLIKDKETTMAYISKNDAQ
ncbi:bifunctional riboflavin kinase/FAD synthetase [Galbibacter pacificus]|uniref:Riboflavin biosynthesis protein n=1 Tax=Galbibacter pacificus TaxID=2996052 RepID=A0ABT6FT25_9FLAO|nr:bifunctional riboflavin kinase/FAD synthetase [Galbibacter pacificus]MDG3582471.1 bifunctional riboflavin kinase/FAD synthetase [Galbibacter pacificus]MDG3586411.1 bifunctional riboflavin kinase/FAD synthetase [Galbibacter pacificus]